MGHFLATVPKPGSVLGTLALSCGSDQPCPGDVLVVLRGQSRQGPWDDTSVPTGDPGVQIKHGRCRQPYLYFIDKESPEQRMSRLLPE